MSSQINLNKEIEIKFITFLERSVSIKYKHRWLNLFQKGVKGWSKIDVWDAWEKNFTNKEVIHWNRNISQLPAFLKGHGATEFVFLGIGHNPPLVTEVLQIDSIIDVLKKNLEGVALTNEANTTLIMNHDGDIMIINSK